MLNKKLYPLGLSEKLPFNQKWPEVKKNRPFPWSIRPGSQRHFAEGTDFEALIILIPAQDAHFSFSSFRALDFTKLAVVRMYFTFSDESWNLTPGGAKWGWVRGRALIPARKQPISEAIPSRSPPGKQRPTVLPGPRWRVSCSCLAIARHRSISFWRLHVRIFPLPVRHVVTFSAQNSTQSSTN